MEIMPNIFVHSAGNQVKAGKSFLFWGIDEEFQSVAVVGLGKKNPVQDDIELISQENESVRVAASGTRSFRKFTKKIKHYLFYLLLSFGLLGCGHSHSVYIPSLS